MDDSSKNSTKPSVDYSDPKVFNQKMREIFAKYGIPELKVEAQPEEKDPAPKEIVYYVQMK